MILHQNMNACVGAEGATAGVLLAETYDYITQELLNTLLCKNQDYMLSPSVHYFFHMIWHYLDLPCRIISLTMGGIMMLAGSCPISIHKSHSSHRQIKEQSRVQVYSLSW